MEPTVQFEPRHQEWSFRGKRFRYDGGDSLVIKMRDLAESTATDLARVLRRARAAEAEPDQLIVDLAPDGEYFPKETVAGPIAFRLDADGALLADLTFNSDTTSRPPGPPHPRRQAGTALPRPAPGAGSPHAG